MMYIWRNESSQQAYEGILEKAEDKLPGHSHDPSSQPSGLVLLSAWNLSERVVPRLLKSHLMHATCNLDCQGFFSQFLAIYGYRWQWLVRRGSRMFFILVLDARLPYTHTIHHLFREHELVQDGLGEPAVSYRVRYLQCLVRLSLLRNKESASVPFALRE